MCLVGGVTDSKSPRKDSTAEQPGEQQLTKLLAQLTSEDPVRAFYLLRKKYKSWTVGEEKEETSSDLCGTILRLLE